MIDEKNILEGEKTLRDIEDEDRRNDIENK